MLRFEQVSKIFAGGAQALDSVTLHIPTGKVTALVGASGSGKTTLLRLAAGLETPSSGNIFFETENIVRGYVFQAPTLMPWASVAENVGLPEVLSDKSYPLPLRRNADVLQHVGLADKANAMPHELSGGQQMRVSIARALVANPELLLLDEPFAALDEITRARLCDLVARLQRERTLTILFVTHSLMEAVFLASRVVLLSDHPGRVAQVIDIEGPAVRDQAFRGDPKFHAQCAALSALMASHAD